MPPYVCVRLPHARHGAFLPLPGEAVRAMVYCHETILPLMAQARTAADKLETLTDASYWPFPVYSDLMFYV